MRSYPTRPWVGVGVVVHKGNDILLVKRAKPPFAGSWSIPGGAQQIGETVFQCAQREVLEESAISVSDLQLIDIVDSIQLDDQKQVQYHYSLIEVSCLYKEGIARASDDALDARWVCYDQLKEYGLREETLRIIHQSYLSRKASLIEE